MHPGLKGLEDVHAYTCEKLEGVLFGQVKEEHTAAMAFLYGELGLVRDCLRMKGRRWQCLAALARRSVLSLRICKQ
jgi:hypothetical protein